MLTGRSSYLDEFGNIAPDATWSMDPLFRIPREDWPKQWMRALSGSGR